ncbi:MULTISPECIES: VF530 family DNA-binding protein [unclassified Oleiphilus]|uniref:VF530 family protein n=1 Tax=unclassified Oleiphilus TaxID=2631174 RepID=UPI0007C33955|nr:MULTISPECIES: VF530 family DNA-binding protein [unclassified Oleiphilus]KZY45783.1 hypothetical protein A3732_09360 [Oleiphilus sp. HI0050]KZY76010.1 hypothetical protein A3740_13965 [Oleiphilus sp. HI0068]KZY85766.1 hypothetical protein A3743_18465 [Oleiphilus sp. HI0072]KZY87000.1 hypothetical protein A3741_13805 [Oleiphilus sp. HI0069]KZZ09762.1 hypothetical protein A3749_01670 [Oleiphilus sp. HI0078]KZZ43986.1 hypothetical protein A3755_21215 [Oleiphilus sp. HI0085]
MTEEINYQNNPLHGLGLKTLVTEIVDFYGFQILHAYLNLNCFKTNPSIESSVKFLKKTDWARERVEAFYLYQFKSLPKASPEQFELPPRDRIIPDGQTPGEPAELSLEDAEELREKRERKAAERRGSGDSFSRNRKFTASPYTKSGSEKTRDKPNSDNEESGAKKPSKPSSGAADPWAKWKE